LVIKPEPLAECCVVVASLCVADVPVSEFF